MVQPSGISKNILRRMKYTSDQRGIMNRYLAEGDNWEEHLSRTQEFIISSLKNPGTGSVTILGSGWLLDLPFEYLCENCRSVYLVDIVHPPQIVNKTKGLANVQLVEADITGGAITGAFRLVQEYRKTGRGSILDITCQATQGNAPADYLVSLNILNQLDILLVDYICRFMEVPEDEKTAFRKRIQQQHLELLEPGRACLVSDISERILDGTAKVISTKPLIWTELPESNTRQEWTWAFDTRGEYNRGNNTEMLVAAVRI
jgi:hypothetical protein